MPTNLNAQPRKWKNKAIVIKAEAVYGVDTNPDGAANWIEARNVSLTPMDVEKVARNIVLPYMGSSGQVLVSFWSKLTFDVALAPSGVLGIAPKWGPLMLACGTAQTVTPATSVVYNLVSSDHGSVCGYINIDGVLHKMLGQRGDVKAKVDAKGTPMLSFSFDSLYMTPVTEGMPVVTRTGWPIEEGVNSTNTGPATIDGFDLAFSSLEWGFGNKIARIDLPGPHREVAIVDRAATASITVLAPDLVDFNPFALAETNAVISVSAIHGSAAGKRLKCDIQANVVNVDYDQIDEMLAYKITLEPVPVAGNDEIVFTCL